MSQTAARAGVPIVRNPGIQLYTLRDAMSESVEDTLSRVARMGYREVEFAGYFGLPPKELRAMLDDLGLRAPSAHIPIEQLQQQLDDTLEVAQVLGHRYLVVPWLAPEQRRTIAQYETHAALFDKIGATCKSAGIGLAYHNHAFEFETLSGKLPYDLLLEATDPDNMTMELDLYWIYKAGHSPVAYFDRFPGRFSLCHVKDMDSDGSIADVGSGVLDFAELLPQALDAGVKHFYVEHDHPVDAFRSAIKGYQTVSNLQR
jgi:sugar phosphate isomerase/epimerase